MPGLWPTYATVGQAGSLELQLLQNIFRAIKPFRRRKTTSDQKEGEGEKMREHNCVECGADVPAYLNYLCEKCWREALAEKLKEDDENE